MEITSGRPGMTFFGAAVSGIRLTPEPIRDYASPNQRRGNPLKRIARSTHQSSGRAAQCLPSCSPGYRRIRSVQRQNWARIGQARRRTVSPLPGTVWLIFVAAGCAVQRPLQDVFAWPSTVYPDVSAEAGVSGMGINGAARYGTAYASVFSSQMLNLAPVCRHPQGTASIEIYNLCVHLFAKTVSLPPENG